MRRVICAYCNNEAVDNVIKIKAKVATKTGVNNLSRSLHDTCYDKINSREVRFAWDNIYQLMQELLGLDDDVLLDSYTVNRLQGLMYGRMHPNLNDRFNKRICDPCTLEEIASAMEVIDSHTIDEYFIDHEIVDNKHKTNIVMRFIVNEIGNLNGYNTEHNDNVIRFPKKSLT